MRLTTIGLAAIEAMAQSGAGLAAEARKPAAPPQAMAAQDDAMAAWQKAGIPGAEHAILEDFEGKWTKVMHVDFKRN